MKNLPKHTFTYFVTGAIVSLLAISCSPRQESLSVDVIPQPVRMQSDKGVFRADESTLLYLPGPETTYYMLGEVLNVNLASYIIGKELKIVSDIPAQNAIRFELNESRFTGKPEAYELRVDNNGVVVEAGTDTGLFYGLQTLLQLITPQGIPYVSIQDEPRFNYRGLHLDVSRNFFPKEFVLKLIDLMSFYKLNTFHWHLTDGAGWRIQLDKYPKLTRDAAFRAEADWKTWWDGDRKFVPEGTEGAYGGYYTKDDIREVVAYAATKHIRVIPEIEMPGHSEEVFVAYPELCCTGKPYTSSDFCVGNEETFTFVENVLTEVMELFPSEYIHVGGDEAGKQAWKTCPKCKKRMQEEGLKNVDELQSYMMRRVEKFLTENGRKLIGWDEILEGGLPAEATVMSWRGESGGIQAAQSGHDVIMTPGGYLYFDFYQADPKTQPAAIGGYTPIKRVYSYEPVPDTLTADEKKHIIGIQANLWTEYIPNVKQVEYMLFPRVLALSEIAWSPQESRNWNDFKRRLNRHVALLQAMDVNTFPLSYEIETTMQVDTVRKVIEVTLDAERYPAEIRYTVDGTVPSSGSSLYERPIVVTDSARIVAAIFQDGQLMGTPTEKKVDYHRGIGKKIHYNSKLYSGYMAGGMNALLDSYRGGFTYLDGRWQGYLNDLDAVVDMGEVTDVRQVSVRFMQLTGPGVYQPGQVELLTSENGTDFVSRQVIPTEISPETSELAFQEYMFNGDWKARYVRIKATEVNKGFIFTDEIVIW
ncbi:MAG: family 20 glycosylhydrolase [Parabacteroides sp.]|nr:family 20 glycosylhydrolase [Parabacteroides sp.]